MIRRLFVGIGLIVLLVSLGLLGLISTESGSTWLIQKLIASTGIGLTIDKINGRLLDHIELTNIKVQNDSTSASVKHSMLDWKALQLLSGKVTINQLTADGVDLTVLSKKTEGTSTFNFDTDVKIPLDIAVNNMAITHIHLMHDGKPFRIESINLSAHTENHQVIVKNFSIESDLLTASANGSLATTAGFPISFKAVWQANIETFGHWQGLTTLSGDLHRLIFEHNVSSPFKLTLHGTADNVTQTPHLQVQGNWENLNWPVEGNNPQIRSPTGQFVLNGLVNDYHLMLNGQLSQHYLPESSLTFDANGGLDRISIKQLLLKSETGHFDINGKVGWGEIPEFDLIANGKQFNPAIMIPELAGHLNFKSHFQGNRANNQLQVNAVIDELNGSLRNQPVRAKGKFSLASEQLAFDKFNIASGLNHIEIDGVLDKENSKLLLNLNMPTMSTLWPGLGGKLLGAGQLSGNWKAPEITLAVQGSQLQFNQHSAKNIDLDLAYYPDNQHRSTFNLIAATIQSNQVKVDKLAINGFGTPQAHKFTSEISSNYGKLTANLNGAIASDQWQGLLTSLLITPPKQQPLSLKKPMPVQVTRKATGFDVNVEEGCLTQKNASICPKGVYLHNGDLSVALITRLMPTEWLEIFNPSSLKISSLINTDIQLQRTNGHLTGDYKINLSPSTITVNTKNSQQTLKLGVASFIGHLKNDKLLTVLDMHLVGEDYLRGKLGFELGQTAALSGSVRLLINELVLFKPFIPQVSNLNGKLNADLSLAGTVQKPNINGAIDLSDGSVDTEQFGLHQLNLHLFAHNKPNNPLSVKGTAIPIIFNKADSPKKIALDTTLNLISELEFLNGINGTFMLALADKTILTVNSERTKQSISMGATTLSGKFFGDTLNAELQMALIGQDYIRSRLQWTMTKTQQLQGQILASVRDFSLFEAFTTQVSHLKGHLSADLTVAGTIKNPQLNGNLELSNASVDIEKLGLDLHEINLTAINSGNQDNLLVLKGSAKSGSGSLALDGDWTLLPEGQNAIKIALTGKDFEIIKTAQAELAISPDLQLIFNNESRKLAGQILIPKASLKLEEIPENAVKVSKDEIILGELEEKPNEISPVLGIQTDIEVKLGDAVKFSGMGLQTDLKGSVKILKEDERMIMQGNIDMDKASYKSYGQNLTVRKGRFVFNGPVDNPWLDVEAIRLSKSKRVTAVLKVSGLLAKPQTQVLSEPSLPESEALAYLVTGGPLSQVSKADSNMLASAALSFGAGQASWLTEKLGIDEFNVEEGNTLKDTLLVMGEYLTPNFYIGTKVGMFNKQAMVVLKHKLTDNFNVESQAGTSQRVKLNYEFDGD